MHGEARITDEIGLSSSAVSCFVGVVSWLLSLESRRFGGAPEQAERCNQASGRMEALDEPVLSKILELLTLEDMCRLECTSKGIQGCVSSRNTEATVEDLVRALLSFSYSFPCQGVHGSLLWA